MMLTYSQKRRLIEAKKRPPPRTIKLDNTFSDDRKKFLYQYRAQDLETRRLFVDAAELLGDQILQSAGMNGRIDPSQQNLLQLNMQLLDLWEGYYKGNSSVFAEHVLKEMQQSVQYGANFAQQDLVHQAGLSVQGLPQTTINPSLATSLARGDIDANFIYTGNTSGRSLSSMIWTDGQRDFNRMFQTIRAQTLIGTPAGKIAKSLVKFTNGKNAYGYTPWKSALRIARTEMAQAFRAGTIEEYNSLDFVEAVKWNLSLSHRPSGCMCETQSRQDLYGLGPGVYPKNEVPPIPHPHCLCYLTAEINKDELKRIFGE